jgi:gliding motility-associated-like protein
MANNGTCNSAASASFSNAAMLTVPATPTISSTAPTCGVNGSSTVSNYNAGLTYIFTPAGPTVGVGGVISGMVVGTNYNVTASNGSCSSSASIDFSNLPMLTIPPTPTISSVAPTCSANGSSTVSNYNAAFTYTFTPVGLTVGVGGAISGMVVGTSYTVTANNGSCNSAASASFSNAAMLPAPIVTVSSNAVCVNGAITLTPTTGGTWVSNNTSVATVTTGGIVSIVSNGTVTFTFTATNTCTATTSSVTVSPLDNTSFNYTSNTHCLTGTNPIPTITGATGGTFTITAPGVLVNSATGEINLLASGLGTFTITYNTTSAGNPCPDSSTTVITITSAPSAAFSYDVAQACQDATNPVISFGVGASAGVFSSSPTGLTLNSSNGAITLSTSSSGIYTVYNYIAPSGGCAEALDSTTIEILQLDNAGFGYTTGNTYCLTGINPTPTITGTTGGTFTISAPGVLVNSTTGEINLSASGLGIFTVTYNTPITNACPQLDSVTINIVNAPEASFTYNTPFCQGNGTALPTFVGNNFAGTFSSDPTGVVFVSTTTGEINLTTTVAGIYMIYNNLAASGGCAPALDSFAITINPIITTPQSVAICQGDSVLLGGMYQTIAGVYADMLTGSLGCDSIVATTLTINPIITTPQNAAICQGDSILLGGMYQTLAGVYADTLTGSLGCDSIVATTLTINPIITTPQSAAICQGDSILLGGVYQTLAGVYADTLTGSLGCDSIVVTTLSINPPLSATPNAVAPICLGDVLSLTATPSGNGTITWYIDAAGLNPIGTGSPFSPAITSTGVYTYYVNEAGICASALTPVTVVVGGVFASIGATPSTGFSPLNVTFSNGSTTGLPITYTWNFGDGTANSNQFNPNHTYTSVGDYTATLIVTDGICYDTTTILIEVRGQSSILIPNVFTPNKDGSNDVFTVAGTNLASVEGVIFNRWGQQLFSWNGVKGYWDGRTIAGEECPDGTYFYIIKAKGNDGAEYAKNGAFSLIR